MPTVVLEFVTRKSIFSGMAAVIMSALQNSINSGLIN